MSEIKVHRRNPLEAILMLNFSKNTAVAWFLWWQRMVNRNGVIVSAKKKIPKREKRESFGRP